MDCRTHPADVYIFLSKFWSTITLPSVDCSQGLSKKPKNNPIMHLRLNPRWRLSRSFRFVRLCLLFLWVFLFSSMPNNPSRTWMRFFTSLKLRSTAIISFKTGIPRLLLCQESTFFLSCVYVPCHISLVKNCICCVQLFCCEWLTFCFWWAMCGFWDSYSSVSIVTVIRH